MIALFSNFHDTGSGQTLLPEGNLHKVIDIDLLNTDLPENWCSSIPILITVW
jgi:hypothetical protein